MIYCSKQESSNCGLSQLEDPLWAVPAPSKATIRETHGVHTKLSQKMGCHKSDSLIDA